MTSRALRTQAVTRDRHLAAAVRPEPTPRALRATTPRVHPAEGLYFVRADRFEDLQACNVVLHRFVRQFGRGDVLVTRAVLEKCWDLGGMVWWAAFKMSTHGKLATTEYRAFQRIYDQRRYWDHDPRSRNNKQYRAERERIVTAFLDMLYRRAVREGRIAGHRGVTQ
ncbi:MAG TPA: hypothetical protein VGD46_19470 [Rhizobacter sp.]